MPRTGDKQRYQFQWFDQRQWHQQQGHGIVFGKRDMHRQVRSSLVVGSCEETGHLNLSTALLLMHNRTSTALVPYKLLRGAPSGATPGGSTTIIRID
jgi:hypothetical protein